MHRPLLLGHRGVCGSSSVQENTLAAFELALSNGCDGFEFDVRVTADGIAVICHSPRFRRRVIAKSSAAAIPEVPPLDAVLKQYAGRAFLDIEIKVSGIGNLIAAALDRNPPSRGFVVSSFLPDVLRELHRLNEAIPLGLICDRKRQLAPWRELPIKYLIPRYDLLTLELLVEAHESGKKVLVWTVNRRATMRRFAAWQVDGIISDNPEWLARALRR